MAGQHGRAAFVRRGAPLRRDGHLAGVVRVAGVLREAGGAGRRSDLVEPDVLVAGDGVLALGDPGVALVVVGHRRPAAAAAAAAAAADVVAVLEADLSTAERQLSAS